MGVLACDRRGCENIMCDRISHGRNESICYECVKELKAKGFCDIDEFMNSEKRCKEDSEAWEEYVDKCFVNRWDDE